MFVWFIVVCLLVLVSLIEHIGIFDFSFLGTTGLVILDVLLLCIVLGILYRMTILKKRGDKKY
jgi:hypothetical protein